jgi:hypothetical protein
MEAISEALAWFTLSQDATFLVACSLKGPGYIAELELANFSGIDQPSKST